MFHRRELPQKDFDGKVRCADMWGFAESQETVKVSPEMYEEFIFPGVCKIADSFENTVIHLHPSQFIPIDYLIKSDINVIELHIDKGGSSAEELSKVHQKVLSQKPLLIWGDLSEADLEYILKNQSYEGLAIIIVVESIEEAHEIWDRSMHLISLKNTKL